MVLGFEVDQIGDVGGSRALGVAGIAQTRSGGPYRFVLALEAVAFERAHAKLIPQEGGAFVFLPKPIVEWR